MNDKYDESGRLFDHSYQFCEMSLPILGDEFTAFDRYVYIPLYINLEWCEDGFYDDEYYDENE